MRPATSDAPMNDMEHDRLSNDGLVADVAAPESLARSTAARP